MNGTACTLAPERALEGQELVFKSSSEPHRFVRADNPKQEVLLQDLDIVEFQGRETWSGCTLGPAVFAEWSSLSRRSAPREDGFVLYNGTFVPLRLVERGTHIRVVKTDNTIHDPVILATLVHLFEGVVVTPELEIAERIFKTC